MQVFKLLLLVQHIDWVYVMSEQHITTQLCYSNGAQFDWDVLWHFSRGTLRPGRTYELVLDAEVDVGDVTEVKFRWNNYIINPLKPKYGASQVMLQRGKDNKM